MNEIVNEIVNSGFEAYIVGGYVRDYLLGLKSYDIDICTNASVSDLIRIFGDRGSANEKYFSYHLVKGEYNYDITSYRKELEYHKNKPVKIELAHDIKTDLLRRDFTINTFAIDRYGLFKDFLNCRADFDNKIIKVVGDTYERLNEDKTRIIRAIRFYSTLGFELDFGIKDFLSNHGDMLFQVPREYIKKELDKIFENGNYFRFFDLVREYNLSDYLSIRFNKVNQAYNSLGVWAQIETTLPLTKEEKKNIEYIKYLISNKSFTLSNLFVYDEMIVKNAGCILNLDREVKEFYEIRKMHSIIDINIKLDVLARYVSLRDIRRVYKKIERSILEGKLNNDEYSIERYIKNRDYERF